MKKPNLKTKVGRYYMAVKDGRTKKEAKTIAGYAPSTTSAIVERTQEFRAIQRYFKDEFLDKMKMSEVADALIDNIRQEGEQKVDRNARNGAIKLALDKLEPQEKGDTSDATQVLIVLGN